MRANINLEEIRTVVNRFRDGNGVYFTSHDFIYAFIDLYNNSYNQILTTYNGNRRTCHQVLANYLRRHQTDLSISKDGTRKKLTYNVNGNVTESQVWIN